MKLIASLIISVSLVIGVVGAMTAYLMPVTYMERVVQREPPPEDLQFNAPAGVDPEDSDEPLAKAGDPITAELLAELREQGVHRVSVNQFFLWGWILGGGMPLFVVGVAGLLGGAFMLRRANRNILLAHTAMAEAAGTAAGGPEAPFESIHAGIERLRSELPGLASPEQLRAIMDTFGEVQRTHVPAFVAARPQLTARLGLGGYAQLMDSFAAAERQINRAWSAAADGVLEEALERVELAAVLMEEAATKLK